jgi:SAM-dependent methyltransferase
VPDLVARLRELLAEPLLRGVDLDQPERIVLHRRILASKPQLRQVFVEIYQLCAALDARHLRGSGRRVEVGAGSSFLRQVVPHLISTDLVADDGLALVADAQQLPFRDGSVRTVYGINCFHHLPDPASFLAEITRVLHAGGGCVLVEPYHGPLARAFYRRVFAQEHFDPHQAEWSSTMTAMRGANQALSYIVFVRDRGRLSALFPQLEIVQAEPIGNYLRYLLSGGLNYRALFPSALQSIVAGGELLLRPLLRVLALHHVIVIRRRA